MPIRFGDHSSDTGVALENGMYDATIKSASLVMDKDKPKINDNGKKQIDIYFSVDEETDVKRRYPIGFGQNKANEQWAAFAKVLEAATGVRCGDPQQKELTDTDLIGKRVRIVVETNSRGYADVVNVMAAPKAADAAVKQKPRPIEEEQQLEEIPF